MQTDLQIAGKAQPTQAVRRVVAACTLLVLLLCSALQATHLHRAPRQAGWQGQHGQDGRTRSLDAAVSLDSETNCPLCISSHSALPAGPLAALRVLLLFQDAVRTARGRLVPTRVAFAQQNRPPPAGNEPRVLMSVGSVCRVPWQAAPVPAVYPGRRMS